MATTKKNDMASFAEQKKRCTRRRWSRTKSFCSECKFLKEFFQKKVLTCEIYLRGSDFDLNCFLHGGALVLFWTATNLTTFSKNFQVNHILQIMLKESTLWKGNLCIYKCFIHVSYIFDRVFKKNWEKRQIILVLIFAICSARFYLWRSTIQ